MRGAVPIVATFGLLAGCGLAVSGLAASVSDGGTILDSGTTPPPGDATIGAPSSEDASVGDDAGSTSDDAPSVGDAGGSDAADAADAACPPPQPDASVSVAHKITPAPKIDGDLSEWGCGGWTELNATNAAYVQSGGQTISGQYAVRWDPMNLYIAAHIVVPTLMGTSTTEPYVNDALEIYVSGDMPTTGDYDKLSHQYIVDWHNTVVDYGPLEYPPNQADTSPKGFLSQVKVVSDGWQVEAAIAWTALVNGKAPTAGATIALDVAFDDGNGTTLLTQLLAMLATHSTTCGCSTCCCGEVSPDPDMPNCDTLCFAGVTLQ